MFHGAPATTFPEYLFRQLSRNAQEKEAIGAAICLPSWFKKHHDLFASRELYALLNDIT